MTRDQKIAEAKRLRDLGLSYSVVGQRLGVSSATAWKWLNPDAARAMRRRSNAKQGPAKRAWENEHDRGSCPCGAKLAVGARRRRFMVCQACYREMRAAGRAMRMQPIYEMWHAGMSLRRIADVMGFSPKGWDTRENAR